MILTTPLAAARAHAQTDSNGLTNSNGIIFANEALVDFHRQLVKAGVDASQLQEAYRDMTANIGTYLYPTDMLFLKAIEVDYTGTGGDSYKRADQVDISNLPNGSFSWLRENGSTSYPQFDDHGDWYEIFPTPVADATSGIRIFYFLKPNLYTSVSDTVAYPENADENILGFRIAANYKRSLESFDAALVLDAEYNKRVKDYIATLSRGAQQPLQASQPNYYNAGWNL